MALHGLFIGIDRFASPRINWLSCARRDALALHTLFTDTFGPGGVLLDDEKATRGAIEAWFRTMTACGPDDVVVITFSGHGSTTHELMTYDADPRDLQNTAIPLATLAGWFSHIPARRLLCVLDCCFSGGMGAKVFVAEAAPRSADSGESLLDQMSGHGRLVLTAATATQRAWETGRYRHGLLTYHLIQALQGAEEVVDAGKVQVYRLLEYVTRRVSADAASGFGKDQQPTLRGQLDGELSWPVFTPGAAYRAAFPGRCVQPVSAVVASLSVKVASVSPRLMTTGLAGSRVSPLGTSAKLRVTSSSKFLSLLTLIETSFVSPCLRLVDGPLSVNVSFFCTVTLNSLDASVPFVGCPVTLTVKSPKEAKGLSVLLLILRSQSFPSSSVSTPLN